MKKYVRRAMAAALAVAMMVLSMGNLSVAQAAEEAVALNISERVFLSGSGPVDNADGSITFQGQDTMKCSFALPNTLPTGESIKVNVRYKFNSDVDTAIRFYLIANAIDSNIATEIQIIPNEGTGVEMEKSFTMTAAADSTELLFASSSYGVNIDNVTIYEIYLGDKPAEEPKAEEPTVEEPTVEEPTVEEPTVEEPTVEEPTVEEPTVEEPTVEEPTVEEPTVEVTAGEYVVKSGDTLGKIAVAYGLTVKELADANNIANADLIRTGAKLTIPTVDTAKRHVVVSGDTLGKIAKKYGYTVAALVDANGIENADLIKVGQLIVFP